MTDNIQRRFIIGDEWAYFKIYSGPKTLESILIHELYQIVTELLRSKIIDQFFFIRYTDPDYHLRLRFHLPEISGLKILIGKLNSSLKYYLDNKLVWKFCADTYNREIERYGNLTMLQAETLFSIDSIATINFLKDTEEKGNEVIRWLWGVKCMDTFLSQFGLTLKDKIDFYGMLTDGYTQEFQINKPKKLQLDKKYRSEMKHIQEVIENKHNNKQIELYQINQYIHDAAKSIRQVLDVFDQGMLGMPLNNLLASLVHMHFNRLFRTKQRMHELVIYYFMHKFYKSQAAKLRYNKEIRISL